MGIGTHDVPENGMGPDRHHWLGADIGFFAQTRTKPAAKDKDRDVGWLQAMTSSREIALYQEPSNDASSGAINQPGKPLNVEVRLMGFDYS